jgi:peptidyl-dipeptidase A
MLQKGSSQKWPQQLLDITGTDKMDIGPLRQYFKPLEAFLDEELANSNETIGWNAIGIYKLLIMRLINRLIGFCN